MLRMTGIAPALVLLAISGASGAAPPALEAEWPGVVTRSLETPAGRLAVHLPDDIRAGDTISGTVVAEPAGKTEAERQRNRDTLGGYVVDVGGRRARRAGDILTFVVPAAGALALLVGSADGRKRIAGTRLHADAAGNAPPPAAPPRLGQAGRPVAIPGPFDGLAETTRVTVGGVPAEIIAESPRASTFRAPETPAGATVVRVSEGGVERQFSFRTVAVSLSAPKSMLKRGESTTLSVRVEGLAPSTDNEPVRLTLVGSPTIRLENGNAQTVELRADAGGGATLQRQVTGLATGPYQISAQVAGRQAAPARDPLFPDALDMKGVNSKDQLEGLLGSMSDAERVALLQATLRALKQRLADTTDEETRTYLKKKIAIVEAVM